MFPFRQETARTANPRHAKRLSAETFRPSAVVQLNWKIVGSATDGSTNTAGNATWTTTTGPATSRPGPPPARAPTDPRWRRDRA
jgi:hypothetical protein